MANPNTLFNNFVSLFLVILFNLTSYPTFNGRKFYAPSVLFVEMAKSVPGTSNFGKNVYRRPSKFLENGTNFLAIANKLKDPKFNILFNS